MSKFDVKPIDRSAAENIQQRIDNLTKPPGALGKLEKLAAQLALIIGAEKNKEKVELKKPVIAVFAGDHGIAEEGISIAPQIVTQQMVLNFLNGGAAINCFCAVSNISLEVIDAGILHKVEHKQLKNQSLGLGTQNFYKENAMSIEVVRKGLQLGAEVSYRHKKKGTNVIGFGEMGIGNTSSASALMAAITGFAVETCVGRGTGVSDEVFNKKKNFIHQALKKHRRYIENESPDSTQLERILSAVGGFEIIQMAGAMLGATEKNMVVLVDGFIATVAALIATNIQRESQDYMVFCHQSHEQGHRKLLAYLQVDPLLTLDLRLGEGTGAALAYPLLEAAASFYNDMASFDSAGIEAV